MKRGEKSACEEATGVEMSRVECALAASTALLGSWLITVNLIECCDGFCIADMTLMT